VLDV
jgi:hypothetical protein